MCRETNFEFYYVLFRLRDIFQNSGIFSSSGDFFALFNMLKILSRLTWIMTPLYSPYTYLPLCPQYFREVSGRFFCAQFPVAVIVECACTRVRRRFSKGFHEFSTQTQSKPSEIIDCYSFCFEFWVLSFGFLAFAPVICISFIVFFLHFSILSVFFFSF